MKKTIYGLLFLSLAGVVSCEKESFEQNTEATTGVRENLEKANTKNYAIGSNPISLQLLRKQYTFGTPSVFGSGASLNDLLYYGVGAYDDDIAALGRTGTNFSDITYRSGIGNHKYGLVKLNGADFLLDEIELIDDDVNKLFGLRGGRIYKLTYNNSTTNFDATLVFSYPGKPLDIALRRFTIAPLVNNSNFIRIYSAKSIGSQPGQPQAMTTLTYIDIDTTNGTPLPGVNVTTPIPGMGDLSSFTAIDYLNTSGIAPQYYIVVEKEIFQIVSTDLMITSVYFDNSVNDCSFYNR